MQSSSLNCLSIFDFIFSMAESRSGLSGRRRASHFLRCKSLLDKTQWKRFWPHSLTCLTSILLLSTQILFSIWHMCTSCFCASWFWSVDEIWNDLLMVTFLNDLSVASLNAEESDLGCVHQPRVFPVTRNFIPLGTRVGILGKTAERLTCQRWGALWAAT